jgi:hypothetical protein
VVHAGYPQITRNIWARLPQSAEHETQTKAARKKRRRALSEIKRKYFLLHVVQNVAELNRGLIRVIGSKFSQRAAEGRLKGLRLLGVCIEERERERERVAFARLCVSLGAASFSLCLQLYLARARVLSAAAAISGVYFIRESATTRLPRVSSVITEQPTVQIARLVLKDAAGWLL